MQIEGKRDYNFPTLTSKLDKVPDLGYWSTRFLNLQQKFCVCVSEEKLKFLHKN